MRNTKEIELMTIKKLELIHFYNLEQAPYIGLNIVYDNGKNLNYNYKYEYFNEFVGKVVDTYKKEKDINNIQFLENESKEIMNKLIIDNPFIKKEKNLNASYDKKYLSRNIEVKFTFEYIKRALSLFLSCMHNEDITIDDLRGYRDRYIATYKLERTYDFVHIIPLTIIKQDNNHYRFNFKYGEEESILLNGTIDLYNDCIALNYSTKENNLSGKNIYHIKEKNKEIIKYNEEMIGYEENNSEVIDNELIDLYLNLLDLPIINRRIRTVDNNYLLIDNIDSNTNYFVHMSLSKNYANVKIEKRFGIIRDNIYVLLDQEKIDTNIFLEQDNNLVIEKNYLKTPISIGEYKNLEGKTEYEYYEIDSDDLTSKFNVIDNKQKKYK